MIFGKLFRDNEDLIFDFFCESKIDKVVNYCVFFMKNVLLFRDMYDVFFMCDGECIVCNVKFEFFCVDVWKYIKYKFLLWRFVVYIIVFFLLK